MILKITFGPPRFVVPTEKVTGTFETTNPTQQAYQTQYFSELSFNPVIAIIIGLFFPNTSTQVPKE
ncbi:hypothetical protein HYFRA_00008623 [Hymenoscyphus fraxineus]|uniref:Uncharacterized protein n=1 Tax=Hymenoscyphus fraxineus TaxID=746836 RepID=A0A9N9PT86_9HELO|nr:hypothetical protein HYFRA_00008623 [Hymenoscyphus fraxineus]